MKFSITVLFLFCMTSVRADRTSDEGNTVVIDEKAPTVPKTKKIQPQFNQVQQRPEKKPVIKRTTPKKVKAAATNAKVNNSPLHRSSIGVGLGQTFLLGDYEDLGEDKITLDFFYSYRASYSFELLLNAHYSKHETGQKDVELKGLVAGIKSHLFHLDSFSPFLLGGLGFYRPVVTRNLDGQIRESDAKFTFGATAGAGIDLMLNEHYTVGILGQLHFPFRLKQETQPAVTGQYAKLLLTVAYIF